MKVILAATTLWIFVMSCGVQAKSAGQIQEAVGVDKIAHVLAGYSCASFLVDRIFVKNKKHRSAKAALICTLLAYIKEKTDTRGDWKDFAATEIGVTIGLLKWRF